MSTIDPDDAPAGFMAVAPIEDGAFTFHCHGCARHEEGSEAVGFSCCDVPCTAGSRADGRDVIFFRRPQEPVKAPEPAFNASGGKYLRKVVGATPDGRIDVYAVLATFGVTCPARQHAVKKLLCAGLRGKADEAQDVREAGDAIARALQLLEAGK